MNHLTALKLRELHKGKPCDKHVFIKETYAGLETGDYACIRCGHEISKKEFKKLQDKNNFQIDLLITGSKHEQRNKSMSKV